MTYDAIDLALLGPYYEWRQGVEELEAVRRFSRIWNYGDGYNYRLWVRGPLLRIING